jgi:hypothetical protein
VAFGTTRSDTTRSFTSVEAEASGKCMQSSKAHEFDKDDESNEEEAKDDAVSDEQHDFSLLESDEEHETFEDQQEKKEQEQEQELKHGCFKARDCRGCVGLRLA